MNISEARKYVEVPAAVPFQGGILSVAQILSAGDHDLLGAEYQTDACAEGGIWDLLCWIDKGIADCAGSTVPAPPGGYKQFGQPDMVSGSPFAVYDGVDCDGPGSTGNEERARRRLGYSEGRQVDRKVTAILEAGKDADLTDVSLQEAIMAFEDLAAANYGGYPVIVMPRSMAVCAYAQRLVERGPNGGLITVNGTQVAATAPADDATTPNEARVYLAGRITLIQGDVRTIEVPGVVRPDGKCDPRRALAERMYVPLIECTVVAATASCNPTPTP
jgi:hypothetical protein